MKLLLAIAAAALAFPAFAQKPDDAQIKRGRYLVEIAGCNDCHTAGYAPSGGKVPEAQWLLGDALGWNGPWGTTYATNLRLYMQGLTEEQWVKKAKTLNARPPMPWFNVRAMTQDDLRAMYRYIRSLGPAGKPAPAYLPPGKKPPPPFVAFPK
ncbi:MAG TPA: c-type cytochrome [Burkholderiales bacterium]|nr:c-type cytochrome [Burkholderiales bacterium]